MATRQLCLGRWNVMATRQLVRKISNLPYRIRRPLTKIQERKALSAIGGSPPSGGLGDGEALESDAPELCGNQAGHGRPVPPKQLVGRGWPELGARQPEV